MNKRKFLQILAGIGTLPAATSWAIENWQEESSNACQSTAVFAAIDVHCHVYNAKDLPIPGFAAQVVLSSWPDIAKSFAQMLIWLLSQLMDAGTISAADELKEIKRGRRIAPLVSGQESDDQAAAKLLRATADRVRSKRRGMKSQVTRMNQRVQHALERIGLSMPSDPEQEEILQLALASIDSSTRAKEDSMASLSSIQQLWGIIIMGWLLTHWRAGLTRRLAELPTHNATEVGLFTPAMLDLGLWVDDPDPTFSQWGDQIEVMSAIAGMKRRRYAVHPFVSFCPWRQLIEPTQFDLVKAAVRKKGFIGVKMYPVMGFLPTDNASQDPKTYPSELQLIPNWACRLDQALTDLYSWSITEDVPIMAHCSQSQTPSKEAGMRAAPGNWKLLLDKPNFANLRLNLAHVGGLWDLALASHNKWTEEVISMLANQQYPNLYADLSDYESIMHRAGTDDEKTDLKVLPQVSAFLDQDKSGVARTKLMYGTDWVMLSRDGDVGEYYPCMRTRLPSSLKINPAGFVGANAARFLGISMKNGKMLQPRQRLEWFYKRHGLNKVLLQRWDS